jgi:hypothetical protein
VPSRDAQAYVVTDVEATRRGIEVSLKRHLHDRYEDHTYLVKVCFDAILPFGLGLRDEECNVAPEDMFRTRESSKE